MTTAERDAFAALLCSGAAAHYKRGDEMIELAHLLRRLPADRLLLSDMLTTIMTQCALYREQLALEPMGEAS